MGVLVLYCHPRSGSFTEAPSAGHGHSAACKPGKAYIRR
jgi:hypothetical protein